jgi:hypothetical protein
VSHQAEERYWTDYVRVATPIVGLLLLLGVFWYWASSLIGSESAAPPPTTPAKVTVIAADTPTRTPTEAATVIPETPIPTATKATAAPSPTPNAPVRPTNTPTTEVAQTTPACASGNWCAGDVVLSADNNVNMRSQPSTSADVLEVLSLDQQLTVVASQPQEAEGIVWWNVRDEATGTEGWVAEEWLKKSQ